MSIRTIQTRYKASSSPSTVLTTIDTNSPSPPGLAAKVLYLNMSTPRTLSPKPSSANTSTLSPLASPYRPKSNRSSSSRHIQNQHLHQQSQRAGARAGRGIPAAPVEVPSSGLVGAGSGIVEPTFGSLPTYQSTSRFDPFGDFTVSESANNSHYFLSQPLRQSPPSSPPSSMTSFAFNDTLHSSDATQPLGSGSGATFKPAYNHYYYYDPMTNSPTLAYGSPPVSSSSNSNRFNHNRNRSNPNYRARNNGNHYNTTNNLSNNYNNNHGRRANSVVNPSFNHSPRPNSRSPSPPSPLTSPTKVTFPSPSTVAFPSQGTVLQDPFADPVVPTAPIEPVPVRTRKRSNTISETRRSPSPPSPSTPPRSPSPPSVAVAEKPTVAPSLTPKKDNSAISKLVAAMLLNRVDAMGRSRCGKRVNSCGTRYVKSGLSRVVCVE